MIFKQTCLEFNHLTTQNLQNNCQTKQNSKNNILTRERSAQNPFACQNIQHTEMTKSYPVIFPRKISPPPSSLSLRYLSYLRFPWLPCPHYPWATFLFGDAINGSKQLPLSAPVGLNPARDYVHAIFWSI